MTSPFGTINAPAFPTGGVTWLNTDNGAISLDSLRGRLVILDFWTFCCINCMHILPTLRMLGERFPDDLAVIGVHTPKFEAEKDAANVAQAISRYDIQHPVLHDPTFQTWQQYAVRAWPTLVFVSPDGKVIGQAPGEPDPAKLAQAVGDMIARGRAEGFMNAGDFTYAAQTISPSRFKYPGKIKVAPQGFANQDAHLLLADSGNHQIVLFDKDGNDAFRIGSGKRGFKDGDFETAQFQDPQGLAASGDKIYVTDTGNHALREIDLTTNSVSTLAGLGRRGPIISSPICADECALASPWDVEVTPFGLMIANAGTHQLLSFDKTQNMILPVAGTGGEDIVDGPALTSLLAQPSGLVWDEARQTLYFADSETSAIRAYRPAPDGGDVQTLVGTGLFDFGHINGPFEQSRLQHALGLALHGNSILVADSYNGIIRDLNRETSQASDWGTDINCTDNMCLPLGEPAGICVDQTGAVFVADTNNHRIMKYDISTGESYTWAT